MKFENGMRKTCAQVQVHCSFVIALRKKNAVSFQQFQDRSIYFAK